MQKIHFHSIDALRFFAFLKVYLLHVPLDGAFPVFSYIKSGGGIGVSFFFVLSGFLISYLLLYDKIQNGQVQVKTFIIRRSLRIWPLFYLMVILAFALPIDFKQQIGFHMVSGGYNPDWQYSFTFLENYNMILHDNFPKTTPLPVFWSLCIEEHFYLLWLLVLFLLPVKYILRFFIFSFVLAWLARWGYSTYLSNTLITTNDLFTNLDFFAGGGILAYFVVTAYQKLTKQINRIPLALKYILAFGVLAVVVFQKELLTTTSGSLKAIFVPSFISLLFVFLILLFIPQDGKFRIKSRLLNYLGSISFGLYVYHIIFIHCAYQYCMQHHIKLDNWYSLSLFITLTLGGSIFISVLSYRYFELPFLRLREKWTNKAGKKEISN